MRILVDNGTYALENMGDVSMLQTCVARLRALSPAATVGVLTRRPERLARYCPGAIAVNALGRDHFVTPGSVLGKLHRLTPGLESVMRSSAPGVCGQVAQMRIRRKNLPAADIRGFVEQLRSADLVVTSGGGYITDEFPWLAERILRTILLAQDMGKRTAMLGQGLGPLVDPKLRLLAARALSRLDLLTLREGPNNLHLLKDLRVPHVHSTITGDDAIDVVRQNIPDSLGNGIGVNLRVTRYSGAREDTMDTLRPILNDAAARWGASLVPVPISFNDSAEDVRVLRSLLGRDDIPADESVQTPEHSVAAAASCRVVVTGAYHAAVFALANGVPAIALAGSAYYVAKFEGLREQFDGAMDIVRIDQPKWPADLRGTIDRTWEIADSIRPTLLDAAERQVEIGRAAYDGMREWFRSKSAA